MSHADRTSFAASLAALLLLAAPAAVSAGDKAAGATTDPAMPAMLQLAVAHSQAADVEPAYHLDRAGRGANPRHGVELAFTPRGARFDGPAGGFALRLERFGRGDGRPVRRAAPRIDGAWVEYDRGLGLAEWFVNLPRGVEQGWTVSERPAGGGALMLELDTARPPDESDDRHLAWSGLVYHRLLALDADGRELPAAWTHDGTRLRIEVDDREAAYPVLIDPWVEQAKLAAEDGAAGDQFGFSVALAGDSALVGAFGADVDGNTDQGAAYVFTRDGGVWSQQAKLTAADGAADDQFGWSVALAGDSALVGAPAANVGSNVFQGAAYVFTRSSGVWSQQAKLTDDDGAVGDFFGRFVALAGDSALVGATRADVDGGFDQGAAYVFTRSGGVWSQQAKLTADDGAADDQFGWSVALAGDSALVGAPAANVGGNVFQGAAYLFTESGGVWSQQAKLTADDGDALENFGYSVALEGDSALVGARGAVVDSNSNQGAAYVFTRNGGVWSQQAKLTAGDGADFDQFGFSVALAGDSALVGAPGADVDGNGAQGAAYVFTESGGVWSQQAKLTIADDGAANDGFGISVALAGDSALVGTVGADVDDNFDQGAAYVFTLEEPELSFDPASLDFGDVELGSSETLIATLENSGNGDASGLNFTLSGVGFEADTSACGESLPSGGSCPVTVTFTPAETGPAAGVLTVASGEGAAADLGLAGNGVGEPVLTFNPPSLDFGGVELGTSETLIAALENSGDDDATGLDFTLSGVGFEADTSACGESLPAGGSCPVNVTFTPTETGPAAGALTAASDEGAATELGLAGSGVSKTEVFSPSALVVDPEAGDLSDGNQVFEPGEQVEVAPAWRNDGEFLQLLTGTAADFTGPDGPAYTLVLDAADYGEVEPGVTASCVDTEICYQMDVGPPGVPRPTTHWDATFEETLSDDTVKTWTLHLGDSFTDVPRSHLFYRFVETALHHGLAVDCGDGELCPSLLESRAMLAMTVLRAREGSDYMPEPCTDGEEVFADVPFDDPFCPWIEELARRQVVAGCGGGNYCPEAPVTRAQMAVFLLKTLEGSGYTPPACSGIFADVDCPSPFADWIEELFNREITGGCATEPLEYCPASPVNRGQCAVFQVKAFELGLYGP